MPARNRYALVKICELTDLELANLLEQYDAALNTERGVEEIAEVLRDLLREKEVIE